MGALMWPEAGMLDHVALGTEKEEHGQAPAPPHRLFPELLHLGYLPGPLARGLQ